MAADFARVHDSAGRGGCREESTNCRKRFREERSTTAKGRLRPPCDARGLIAAPIHPRPVTPHICLSCSLQRDMATIQVSAAKATPLARNLPTSLTFDKPYDALTVSDVKTAIAAKNPKVRGQLVNPEEFD